MQVTAEHLKGYGHLRAENQQLVCDNSIVAALKHYFIPSYHTSEVKKVVAFLKKALLERESSEAALKLSNALIVRYGTDKSVEKILRVFDREVRPYRSNPSIYLHPENDLQFSKWTRASQPHEIFHQFPEFAEFLHQSKLLSQIKITRETLQILDGEPAILVEGDWMKASEMRERFKVEDSERYGTRFIIDAKTNDVYTYLDNRRGLQKYHPYQTLGTPICSLEEAEIKAIQTKANEFVRPEEKTLPQEELCLLNAKRPFTMQIVTSYIENGDSNFSETLRNPQHAYLRLVAGRRSRSSGLSDP